MIISIATRSGRNTSIEAAFHDTDTDILARNRACRCRGMRPLRRDIGYDEPVRAEKLTDNLQPIAWNHNFFHEQNDSEKKRTKTQIRSKFVGEGSLPGRKKVVDGAWGRICETCRWEDENHKTWMTRGAANRQKKTATGGNRSEIEIHTGVRDCRIELLTRGFSTAEIASINKQHTISSLQRMCARLQCEFR